MYNNLSGNLAPWEQGFSARANAREKGKGEGNSIKNLEGFRNLPGFCASAALHATPPHYVHARAVHYGGHPTPVRYRGGQCHDVLLNSVN